MHNINILIIENESLVAMELSAYIKTLGYNIVEYATTSIMARSFLELYDVDLILMDVNLEEEIDGITLYKSFQITTPIIYITAYIDEETISKAIETNPLGYLVKPHNEYELKALLQIAKLKIHPLTVDQKAPENTVSIGERYAFNNRSKKLYFGDILIKLTLKEAELLGLLITAKGAIVSYEKIEEILWGEKYVSNTAIRTLIYRLRCKLEHKLIETEFKQGIKLKF